MKKLFERLKEEKLTQKEKTEMLSVLKDFVKKNPVKSTIFSQPIKSPFYSSFWGTIKQRKFAILPTFLLIFILTTSTTFGAMSSLPGDILYPVKILNENVRSFVAIGPKAKARISTEQAISRLEEAEKLATRGNLTSEKTKELKSKFEEHSDKIKKNIEDLKKEGDVDFAKEVSSRFKNSINHQKENIDKLTSEEKISTSSRENFSKITSHVDEEIKNDKEKSEEIDQTGKNLEETQKNESARTRKSSEVKTEIRSAEEKPENED